MSLNILTRSTSVDLLPHHNSLCLGHPHRHISTPLPLQLGLGVEELGLEGKKQYLSLVTQLLSNHAESVRLKIIVLVTGKTN